jgi:hypothetical protein
MNSPNDELLFLFNFIDNSSCFVNNLTSSVIFCNLFRFCLVSELIINDLLSFFKYLSNRFLRDGSVKGQSLADFSNISIIVVFIFVS